jgi:Zn-dependent peptidase ImmA (M78 family)/transcriptional regulator with XRE-family HTH domain
MNVQFNATNLRIARLANDLSIANLGDSVGKSRQYLARLEAGVDVPSLAMTDCLAEQLDVAPDFFYNITGRQLDDSAFHFRKLATTKPADKLSAIAKVEIFSRFFGTIEKRLSLPKYDFPTMDCTTAEDIERAAEKCRSHWGLGLGPISNGVRLMENAGAVVTSFNSSQSIDALSILSARPIVVINKSDSACRVRFDHGHECGHFVMHFGRQTGDPATESEANRFSSALLMPRTTFAREFPAARGRGQVNWKAIVEMKFRWKTSKAAILYRAKQLGLISDSTYKHALLSGLYGRGQRKVEVEDAQIVVEKAELLPNSLEILKENFGITTAVLAREINIGQKMLRQILPQDMFDQAPVNPEKTDNVLIGNFGQLKCV